LTSASGDAAEAPAISSQASLATAAYGNGGLDVPRMRPDAGHGSRTRAVGIGVRRVSWFGDTARADLAEMIGAVLLRAFEGRQLSRRNAVA
jgi:hypothetical protein